MSTTPIVLDHALELNLSYLKDALNSQEPEYQLLDVIYLRGIIRRINSQLIKLETELR